MAQTALSIVTVTEAPALVAEANADVANGNSVQNPNEDVMLVFRNSGVGNACTATVTVFTASTTKDGFGTVTKASAVVLCTAGQEKFAGPFPRLAFNNANNDLLIAYTGADAADMRVRAVKVSGLKHA